MTTEFISFNNQILDKDTPVFTVANRSFNYGDGFFETIRWTGQDMPFLKQHIERIKETAAILELILPDGLNEDTIRKTVWELSEKNKIKKDGRVKINIFRNEGGWYAPETNQASWVISAIPLKGANGFELNNRGLKVDLYQKIKKPSNILGSIKSSNSLLYVLAGKYQIEHEYDDVVILNDKYNVCEFTGSNLFIVINGVLYTPALTEGCVGGVMRKIILDLASKSRINIYEVELKPNDLIKADEIFMTNALLGIRWVSAYKAKRYFNKVSKTLADVLNEYAQTKIQE